MKADAAFFAKANINDYSILLGIAEITTNEAVKIFKSSPDLKQLYAEGIINEVEKDQVR